MEANELGDVTLLETATGRLSALEERRQGTPLRFGFKNNWLAIGENTAKVLDRLSCDLHLQDGQRPDGVVDDQLGAHGLERLRVADASVMPTVTSTNTNSPTIMIAERGAKLIGRAARRSRRSGQFCLRRRCSAPRRRQARNQGL